MSAFSRIAIWVVILLLLGLAVREAGHASLERTRANRLRRENTTLSEQLERVRREQAEATRQVANLRERNEQLRGQAAELAKLRSELAEPRETPSRTAAVVPEDGTASLARAWAQRVELLKQRLDQWPGKGTPEVQLLSEQDWLNVAANNACADDNDVRRALGKLRTQAKWKFGQAAQTALDQFTQAHPGQLPSDPSQLVSYLPSSLGPILAGYEIAPPGALTPPTPNSPGSELAKTWALVEKGSLSRQSGYLADPENDARIVIYPGGSYAEGPTRRVP